MKRTRGLLLLFVALIGAGFFLWWKGPPSSAPTPIAESPAPAAPSISALPAANASQVLPVAFTPDAPTARPLAELDVRAAFLKISAAREAAVADFKTRHRDVSVDADPVTGSPKWIASETRLLTGPAPDAEAAVRDFIEENRALFGHGAAVLGGAAKTKDYVTEHNGIRTAVWQQRFAGLEIFEAIFKAHTTARGEIINVGSQLVPDAAAAAGNGTPDFNTLIAQPPVAAQRAVSVAAASIGDPVAVEKVAAIGAATGGEKKQTFRTARHTDVSARLVWVPLSGEAMRPAWDMVLMSKARGEMYRVLVDAEKADVLVRHSLTSYISDATYRVFTGESPTPFSPGHDTLSSLQPPLATRTLLTTPALNTTASPNGWIDDGNMETNGNNVDAHTDTDSNNVADLPRPNGGAARVFDFPLDLALDPATSKNAAVTQLFYWCNFAHDRMYDLGFTEAAGNFQVNNFGRGGTGGDALQADAQDGSGTNNANFSTSADGSVARLQMFLWTGPNPDRDTTLDGQMVLHEYAHGLSLRLVGAGAGITALASRGLGEGWSDFFALALTARAEGDAHGNWPLSAYAAQLYGDSLTENYYFGLRRFPYSTDLRKNPFTFKDIDPGKVDWHTAVPRNPTRPAIEATSEVHYSGTVWCAMLWEMRANLVLKHGFATGNDRALRLVTDGMKLAPANPNFVQARTAIVQAATVGFPGDLGEVWTAFAKRGLGQGAAAPASTSTTGVTESYLVADGLLISDRGGWNIAGNLGGPFTPAATTLTLKNTSAAALTWSVNPNAAWLAASPASGTLAAGASIAVTFTPQADAMPSGTHSTNVVFTNTTTNFNHPIGVRLTVTPPRVQLFDFTSDPGWTRTGEWAFGAPAGGGGSAHGFADPAAGATGANVFGVNLAGDPTTNVGGPFYVTSAPINLTGRTHTRLRFLRWLNADALAATRATVEISTDGATWREVFVNGGTPTTDNAWRAMDYDISSLADLQPAVSIRWGYRTLAAAQAYSGWNIDDVEILGETTAQFTITMPASATEGSAPLTATLLLNVPQAAATTVALASSNPAAATVPASLTLAPGQVSATFAVTPINDAVLDGSQPTTITASAAGIATGAKIFTVHDNETATLTLTAPASAIEGQSGLAGSVSVSAAPAVSTAITLTASSGALAVPATVTIPGGSTGPVAFTFSAPENDLAEGVKNATITASVVGWTGNAKTVAVADNDTATLTLTGPASAREGDGPRTFTATVNAPLAANLTVALASSDTSEATVPATITIPAGQFSATFSATIIDDALRDGAQAVTLTPSAAGYIGAPATLAVADNDADHFTFAPIASPRLAGSPFSVSITARTLDDVVVAEFGGSANLSASPAVPFTPATVVFSNGQATSQLTVTATATALVLTATDAGGRAGSSASFDVVANPLASFVWLSVPASATVDVNFAATVAAQDEFGVPATGYQEPTKIETVLPVLDRTIGTVNAANVTPVIYNTAFHDSRATMLFTAAELGPAKWIGALAFTLGTPGGQSMLGFTVRVKTTALTTLEGAAWDATGWTAVFSATQTSTAVAMPFVQPFYHDGVSNLLVDISFNNTTASSAGSVLFGTTTATSRVMSGTSNSAHGVPSAWTAATGPAPQFSTQLPLLSLYAAQPISAVPGSPVTFTNGEWSDFAYFPAVGALPYGWLRATAPSGIAGFSNRVTVNAAAVVPTGTDVIFSDGFETGLPLASPWSTAGGAGAERVAVSPANTPRGAYHLQCDSTSATGSFARNQATLTLDLTGRTNVSVENFTKGFNEDAHAAPAAQPFGSAADFDGIAISADGANWYLARNFAPLTAAYPATATRVPLDPIAQQFGLTYGPNFRIKFVQYGNQPIPVGGVAIDDVAVRGNPANAIVVLLPPTIAEGSTGVEGIVRIPNVTTVASTVTLVSIAPARLIVPATVIVPAGASSNTFTVSAPENQTFDNGRPVYITSSGNVRTHVRILDNETGALSITLPPTISESDAPATGTVSVSPVPASALTVLLANSHPAEASVPSSITIPAGASAATFTLTPVDDLLIDGTKTVTISASGAGLIAAAMNIDVLDNDTPGADTDGDGMTDAYELANGLNPLDNGTADPLRGPLGDLDADGLRNLLEYAFNTRANIPDTLGLPTVERLLNPADGKTYPILTHRRRIVPGPLQYILETSPNLTGAWAIQPPALIEQIGAPIPTGDGITESVKLRLKPAFEDSALPRFHRIRVSVP